MNPERKRNVFNSRLIKVAAFTTFTSGAAIILRESQRRKTERKQIQAQQAVEDSDTGEGGAIFVEGKSCFIGAA